MARCDEVMGLSSMAESLQSQARGGNERQPTLAEACEAAGRGNTSGATVHDSDVIVKDPDDRSISPQKIASFEDVREFPREVLDQLRKAGFPGPSQVQAFTWPLSLQGVDVIGIAATGSGKTLAFLLPAFSSMHRSGWWPERQGPA